MTQAVNLANFANNLDTSGGVSPTALNAAVPISKGGTASTTASAARTSLGLAIGTDVPSPTGTGASGTWGISITGNAATATAATTATTATTANAIVDGAVSTTAKLADSIVTPAKLTQPLTRGTAVASTSGTNIDFTSLPSWIKRITVMFNGVSTNGSSLVQIQVGAGSVVTSGYTTGLMTGNATAILTSAASSGHVLAGFGASSYVYYGSVVFTNISGNTWISTGTVRFASSGDIATSASSIALGGTLDRVRVTTVNGTDTFDAGSINILYE